MFTKLGLRINSKIKDTTSPMLNLQRLYHVRGFVDERVVVRWWSRGRQVWEYDTLTPYWFLIRSDNITIDGDRLSEDQVNYLRKLYTT